MCTGDLPYKYTIPVSGFSMLVSCVVSSARVGRASARIVAECLLKAKTSIRPND